MEILSYSGLPCRYLSPIGDPEDPFGWVLPTQLVNNKSLCHFFFSFSFSIKECGWIPIFLNDFYFWIFKFYIFYNFADYFRINIFFWIINFLNKVFQSLKIINTNLKTGSLRLIHMFIIWYKFFRFISVLNKIIAYLKKSESHYSLEPLYKNPHANEDFEICTECDRLYIPYLMK